MRNRQSAIRRVAESGAFLFLCAYVAPALAAAVGAKASLAPFPSNQPAYAPAISADGRYVAYFAFGSNIIENDTNGVADVVVADRVTGAQVRASVATGGSQANAESLFPSISADGRFVAFESRATNLIGGDTNGTTDVFVRDIASGATTRASTGASGQQADGPSRTASVSADGRVVAFVTDASNLAGTTGPRFSSVVVKNLATGAIARAAPAGMVPNAPCEDFPVVSDDGRYVAFACGATNLVANDTNAAIDVFVYDATTGAVERINAPGAAAPNGASRLPSISGNGRIVVFQSAASNLVANDTNGVEDVFRYDRSTGAIERVSVNAAGVAGAQRSYKPWVSRDGTQVAFYSRSSLTSDDTNSIDDVYVRSEQGTLRVVTRGTSGAVGVAEFYASEQGRPAVANGGAAVAFNSWSSYVAGDQRGWGQVYAFDAAASRVSLVSAARTGQAADGQASQAAIDGDASLVVFSSQATNVVASGDVQIGPDVYVRDVAANSSSLVSRAGNFSANDAYAASISADGSRIAFQSITGGVDAYDGIFKIYVRDRASGAVQLASRPSAGGKPNSECIAPTQSGDGRYVAFVCAAGTSNMVAGDNNNADDVFVRDLVAQTTVRASVGNAGGEGNGRSLEGFISADARYVVFTSFANNLVPGDTNATSDVFLRDLQAGTTTRVSVGPGGVQANGSSRIVEDPFRGGRRVISDDGRYVVFVSNATNLVPGVPASVANVFVVDRQTGQVELASRGPAAGNHNGDVREPAISGDGRFVVFTSTATNLVAGDTNQSSDAFLYDRSSRQLTRVSVTASGGQANGSSLAPMITRDGATILIRSEASNLVAGDDNATTDQFLVDRATLGVVRVTPRFDAPLPSAASKRAPSTSADGNLTTLISSVAPGAGPLAKTQTNVNLPQLYDWLRNKLDPLNNRPNGAGPSNGTATSTSVASDGSAATFTSTTTDLLPGDSSGNANVYYRQLPDGPVIRVSQNAAGPAADGPSGRSAVSRAADGGRVAFESRATNLEGIDSNGFQDVFVATGLGVSRSTFRASGECGSNVQANGPSSDPAISPGGRYVAFASTASNLVGDDNNGASDVFVCDVIARRIVRVAPAAQGASGKPAIAATASGWRAAFESDAGNLVANDNNGVSDVFVAEDTGAVALASRGLDGRAANGASGGASLSADGRFVSFVSDATNLVPGDDNFQPDVFVYDRESGVVTRANTAADGRQADDVSLQTAVASSNGSPEVVWDSAASNIVDLFNNGAFNIYKGPGRGGAPRGAGSGSSSAGIPIVDGLAGLWYDPTTAGQGWAISLSRAPAARITVAWYTYEPAPGTKPVWLFGSTDTIESDNTAVVDMVSVEGGSFPPNFVAAQTSVRPWGRLRMRFGDCNAAAFSWQPQAAGYGAGSANVVRLTATDGVPCAPSQGVAGDAKGVAVQRGHAGLWYNAQTPGQGWVLSIAPPPAARYTITWYTFEPSPSTHPVWMIGSTDASGNGNALQFELLTLDGTSFMPQFDRDALMQRPWGTLRLEFTDCDRGTMSWTPTQPGYAAGSLSVQRLAASAGIPCVP